jgi:hypothetical protein
LAKKYFTASCFSATELEAYKQDGRLKKLERDLEYETEKNKELVAKISLLTAQKSKQSPHPSRSVEQSQNSAVLWFFLQSTNRTEPG